MNTIFADKFKYTKMFFDLYNRRCYVAFNIPNYMRFILVLFRVGTGT